MRPKPNTAKQKEIIAQVSRYVNAMQANRGITPKEVVLTKEQYKDALLALGGRNEYQGVILRSE